MIEMLSIPYRPALVRFVVFMAVIAALTMVPRNGAAQENYLQLSGPQTQGGFLLGKAPPGTVVTLDKRSVRLSAGGQFVVGFGRDHGATAKLEAVFADGTREVRELAISRREYSVQRIDGLPPKMVTPPPEVLARIRRENGWIGEVRARDTDRPLFLSDFIWPLIGPVSGVFGSQRILNGKPRRPHYGVDVAAGTGAPVHAPADGLVALAEDDLYYTGGTVMLDHGHGLTSVYSHLSKVTVANGDEVRQGDLIGEIGATGRATGPHLDWRINWFDQRLDPALFVGPMPVVQKPQTQKSQTQKPVAP